MAIRSIKWTEVEHLCFSVSHRPPLFPDHWPSCSFAQHRLVAITQTTSTAQTLQTHTYVCLPCIYLFTFFCPFLFCKNLSLDQVIMNIFGLWYNEIESQV